ncbi:signal peptide peptidase A. Serine peptidase. MEROPS family S49 [Halobacillus karajensis]|uniref:signal peptide peptidase SppA n=1 Tax=Halobacillus karajensis TaxID=195088 RepID=UPI0008A7342A|nr:signal peptide peptidase SppA [Halobacillus karajensis]SEH83033.1 signal peptide peptidase A. Serine peptidase. MEROPS family S49 [Halobacillus karajensis]
MSKRIIASIIAASILIIALSFQLVGSFIEGDEDETDAMGLFSNSEKLEEKVVERGSSNKRIVELSLEGAIIDNPSTNPNPFGGGGYQHDRFLKKLETIKEDASIKGVHLYVNSPGGGVYESAEIHDKLLEIQEAGKTIYVSMGNMAASGGYYISAPADRIFASNDTFTGSLGVIMESINYQELANEYGVKFNTIKSGEFKDIMSPTKEMTDADREILQTLVDESYQQFVDVIAEGRDMSENRVKELADGRIYSGKQAVENGLVDEIGFREDTLKALKEEIGGDPQVFEYKNNMASFFNLPFAESLMPNSEIRYIEKLISQRQGPRMMYMYTE